MVKDRLRNRLLLTIGGLAVGYSLLQLPSATAGVRPPQPSAPETQLEAPAERIGSLETPATAPSAQTATSNTEMPLATFGQSLQSYLARRPGTWSYYLIDLTTGQTASQGAQRMSPAASTIKLPLALYVYDEVAQGRSSLAERITFQEIDWQDGAGYLVEMLKPGDSMPVGELVEIMIRHSDNVAKNMLMRRFGQEGLFAWIHAQGGQVELRDDGDGGLIYTNVETLARMMRLLYKDQAFGNPAMREKLLTDLQNTIYKDRSAAGVPSGVQVAHKVGNLPAVVNDIALVWAPHGPFILAALSEGTLDEPGLETITTLTTKSYQFLEQQHQSS